MGTYGRLGRIAAIVILAATGVVAFATIAPSRERALEPAKTPIELSDDPRESYATQAHSTLQNVDHVLTQLMGVLSRQSLGAFRGSPFDGFRLDVDDLTAPGQPFEVGVETGGPVPAAVVSVRMSRTPLQEPLSASRAGRPALAPRAGRGAGRFAQGREN